MSDRTRRAIELGIALDQLDAMDRGDSYYVHLVSACDEYWVCETDTGTVVKQFWGDVNGDAGDRARGYCRKLNGS